VQLVVGVPGLPALALVTASGQRWISTTTDPSGSERVRKPPRQPSSTVRRELVPTSSSPGCTQSWSNFPLALQAMSSSCFRSNSKARPLPLLEARTSKVLVFREEAQAAAQRSRTRGKTRFMQRK